MPIYFLSPLINKANYSSYITVRESKHKTLNIYKKLCSNSDLAAKSDREPVDNFSHGHKADSKTKSTKAAKAGDEVQPSHLWQPCIFWKYIF